ncbi:MAG: prepilin peptidase [Peptococcaceae bacterium]|nr:prepilin peptidase [Peptococcaceae bacterium]
MKQRDRCETKQEGREKTRHQTAKTAFILTGILISVSMVLRFSFGWQALKFTVMGCLLLVISIIDYRSFIIPDGLILLGLVLYVSLSLFAGQALPEVVLHVLLHGCSVAVPLLLFVLLADFMTGQETMGGGDIKLFFLLGVYLKPSLTWLTLFLSCVTGLFWHVLQCKWKPGEAFPFGPSIAAAAWLTVLWGQPVLDWYLDFLLPK